MTRWLRFTRGGAIGFGTLDGEGDGQIVHVHRGDMFGQAEPTGEQRSESSRGRRRARRAR
jgi:hypothetical protein